MPDSAARIRELRNFGLVVGAMFAGVFGVVGPWLRARPSPIWPWIVGAVLVATATLRPQALRYLFLLWSAIGRVLGAINTRIILGLIYLVMIVPMAMVMRALGRDPMNRGFDRERSTYRVQSRKASKKGLERPF